MTDEADLIISAIPSLSEDEDILAAAKALVIASLDAARDLIQNAAPPVREPLIRSLLPAAVRLLADRDNQEYLDEMRTKMEEVLAEVKGSVVETEDNVVQLVGRDER